MEDKEVLQKAIEIAIENGMKTKDVNYYTFNRFIGAVESGDYSMIDSFDCYNLIFSHSFAKAFFGDNNKIKGTLMPEDLYTAEVGYVGAVFIGKDWQYHLQQMVLCDNPIEYLRKFIDTAGKGFKKGDKEEKGIIYSDAPKVKYSFKPLNDSDAEDS